LADPPINKTDDRHAGSREFGKIFKNDAIITHEAGFQHKVLGWVSSDGQFAESHNVAFCIYCLGV